MPGCNMKKSKGRSKIRSSWAAASGSDAADSVNTGGDWSPTLSVARGGGGGGMFGGGFFGGGGKR